MFLELYTFISQRPPLKEAQQEVFVPQGATVHRVQRLLSPALWGNTVEPKETKNQMTVSYVIQGMFCWGYYTVPKSYSVNWQRCMCLPAYLAHFCFLVH